MTFVLPARAPWPSALSRRPATGPLLAGAYNPRPHYLDRRPMAQTMKALVKREAGKGIWMEELPIPQPGPNEVLIKR